MKSLGTGKVRLSEKSFVLFIQYPPDEGLFLLDCRQSVSDPKTGRYALTNQRSAGYPLGTDLSNRDLRLNSKL